MGDDGLRGFDVVRSGDYFELVGEEALLDQFDPVLSGLKPYRSVMLRLPILGDVHREAPIRRCVSSLIGGGSTGNADRF